MTATPAAERGGCPPAAEQVRCFLGENTDRGWRCEILGRKWRGSGCLWLAELADLGLKAGVRTGRLSGSRIGRWLESRWLLRRRLWLRVRGWVRRRFGRRSRLNRWFLVGGSRRVRLVRGCRS
ncbi:hypothetical protein Ae717Ps2_5861c [Pseudonocardia sp. Ae717_Ps2]|nr:hypothetical protein Ae717Ps2_5786c [Pseudonocardia sp. Ae717_Ps2]OLM29105.1 hypothetical protein Ae717Ps2_5861c [Pseudonocardia sp. Ae717_Ps2]